MKGIFRDGKEEDKSKGNEERETRGKWAQQKEKGREKGGIKGNLLKGDEILKVK